MNDARIRFPVVCPVCGVDSLVSRRLADVVRALYCAQTIALASQCHGARWEANPMEMEQIWDYCMATLIHALGINVASRATAEPVVTDSP